jgi:hypothetical protein
MSREQTNIERKKRVAYIKKVMASGDRRSFAALDADIELRNWTERFHPNPLGQIKTKKQND